MTTNCINKKLQTSEHADVLQDQYYPSEIPLMVRLGISYYSFFDPFLQALITSFSSLCITLLNCPSKSIAVQSAPWLDVLYLLFLGYFNFRLRITFETVSLAVRKTSNQLSVKESQFLILSSLMIGAQSILSLYQSASGGIGDLRHNFYRDNRLFSIIQLSNQTLFPLIALLFPTKNIKSWLLLCTSLLLWILLPALLPASKGSLLNSVIILYIIGTLKTNTSIAKSIRRVIVDLYKKVISIKNLLLLIILVLMSLGIFFGVISSVRLIPALAGLNEIDIFSFLAYRYFATNDIYIGLCQIDRFDDFVSKLSYTPLYFLNFLVEYFLPDLAYDYPLGSQVKSELTGNLVDATGPTGRLFSVLLVLTHGELPLLGISFALVLFFSYWILEKSSRFIYTRRNSFLGTSTFFFVRTAIIAVSNDPSYVPFLLLSYLLLLSIGLFIDRIKLI